MALEFQMAGDRLLWQMLQCVHTYFSLARANAYSASCGTYTLLRILARRVVEHHIASVRIGCRSPRCSTTPRGFAINN